MPKLAKKKKPAARKRKVAGKRKGRDTKGRLLPGWNLPGAGKQIGPQLSSILRRVLNESMGDKTKWEWIVHKFVELVMTGNDWKHAHTMEGAMRMFQDRLEGKPAQTIIADVTKRDDPIGRLPSEEKKTLLRRYLDDFGVEGVLD